MQFLGLVVETLANMEFIHKLRRLPGVKKATCEVCFQMGQDFPTVEIRCYVYARNGNAFAERCELVMRELNSEPNHGTRLVQWAVLGMFKAFENASKANWPANNETAKPNDG